MKKIIQYFLVSVLLVSNSCTNNLQNHITTTNSFNNIQNNLPKGLVSINFNLSEFKNKNFNIKNFDLSNPEISKIKIEIVGKNFSPISLEKTYISGQNINFDLQVPIGKNRVILLYTLDKMGNILSQFMGALDVKIGSNNASISYIDTVIAQVLYSMILDKNERNQDNYFYGGGATTLTMPPVPPDPFVNFNLNEENTKLLESLSLEELKKYIYEYTGFDKDKNTFTKKDPLSFNSIWLAKQLVQNNFLKKDLFPPQTSKELSGLSTFILDTSPSRFDKYSSKFKVNFSDLNSKSGIYTPKELEDMGRFAMPGVWNVSLEKVGYPTKNHVITIDPNCCPYYIHLAGYKMDKDKSYHSRLDDITKTPNSYSYPESAELLISKDEKVGEINLNISSYTINKENAEITILDEKNDILMNIPAQDGYYLLKGFPITISEDMLKFLKERKLYLNVFDKSTKKHLKGKIINNNFTDFYVYLRGDDGNLIEGAKINIKSLELGNTFNENVLSEKFQALVENVPIGKIEVTAEKEGYATRTNIIDTNESTTLYLSTYKIDTTPPKIISISLDGLTPTESGDMGFKRPITNINLDDNTNYVPNLDSKTNTSISLNSRNLIIYFHFSSPIKRETFENNFKILSEISNTYNGKEIVRGTNSDDAGFIPAFVIDKNTDGASFNWLNDDRTVVFQLNELSERLFWLNSNKELKYKLTFSQPFEDLSGQKAYSATSENNLINGAMISNKGGYIKYNDSLFADYLTFSIKKNYMDDVWLNSWGRVSEGNKLSFGSIKPINVIGKSLIPKLDLNGNIINDKLIYDKVNKQIKYVDIDGKIKSLIKLYLIKANSKVEEPFDIGNTINYNKNLNEINLSFDKRVYSNGDKIYFQLLANGIDGSTPVLYISYI